MITISENQLNEIRGHGIRDYPYECCGLLLGRYQADGKVVTETYPISNAREESAKRNRFLITPEELMRGEQYARARDLEIVGFYHSHPDSPAAPSQYDLDHAWPFFSYIIVSVRAGKPEAMTSWRLREDRSAFDPERLTYAEHH